MRALLLLLLVSLAPLPARAELASLFGIGPKSEAMGGVALIQDQESPFQVYSAPAALGYLRHVEIDFGAQYFQPNIRPYGTLVISSSGTLGDFNDAGVLPGGGSQLAFAIPLGPGHPFVLGASFYLPFTSLIRVTGNPVNYPFYPLYSDVARNLFFVVGAGYEFAEGWAAGVNIRSTTKSTVSYVLRTDSSVNYSASATEAKSQSRLSFSMLYDNARKHPGEAAWTAGAMYRGYSGMETKIAADVSAFVPIQGSLTSQPAYTPAEWVAMGTWKLIPELTVSAEISRVLWGAYQSPYGSGNINSYVIDGKPREANFRDVWVPRLGLEESKPVDAKVLKKLFFRQGYQLHPSPVPDQTGDSNYVDNTRHLFSVGAGASLANPFKENDIIDVDLFFQYNLLKKRQISKTATNAVGAPGYLAGGNILLFGGGVSLRF